MCNCFSCGRQNGCSALSANEVREAVRTAEAAAQAAARAAKEAEATACRANEIVKNADSAVCAAEAAAKNACQCAAAAEAAKERICYMLEQFNRSSNGNGCADDCGHNHHDYGCEREVDCGCDYRY